MQAPIITRIEKLIRLAVCAGATTAERDNAAKEAVRLIDVHRLVVIEREPQLSSWGSAKPARARWLPSRASVEVDCSLVTCTRLILKGDDVLVRGNGLSVDYCHKSCAEMLDKHK